MIHYYKFLQTVGDLNNGCPSSSEKTFNHDERKELK